MQLSRESISHAALGILDTYGLADVTMRRVASTLGVAPGALYWHIENKQELISAIATLIVGSLVDAPGTETLTPDELCARLRGVLLAHRDGAEVVISAMSQPESPVAATLSGMMLEAVERDAAAHGANEGASASALRAAADGLLYLTLGAATVHQSAAQLAQATGDAAGDAAGDVAGEVVAVGAADDVGTATSFLLAGLRSTLN